MSSQTYSSSSPSSPLANPLHPFFQCIRSLRSDWTELEGGGGSGSMYDYAACFLACCGNLGFMSEYSLLHSLEPTCTETEFISCCRGDCFGCFHFICVLEDYSLILIMGCFHSKMIKEPQGYEDPTILAGETACESSSQSKWDKAHHKFSLVLIDSSSLSLSLAHSEESFTMSLCIFSILPSETWHLDIVKYWSAVSSLLCIKPGEFRLKLLKVYSRIKGIFSMVRSTISSSKACSTLCHGHLLWWGQCLRSRLVAIWKGVYIYIYIQM